MLLRQWFPIALVLLLILALPGFVLFALDVAGESSEANAWLEDHLGLSHHLAIGNTAGAILFFVPVALLILYFLKLKRKPHSVASTFLWKKSIEDLHVNRLMQWLRKNILLLLQLLVVFSLLYAILGPRLHGSTVRGKHYILIIDNSASMSATDVMPNRLEWAKGEALKEIDAATDDDVGMVVVFNQSAEVLQSYTSNKALLRKAIEDIQPTPFSTRIDEALSYAASLANPDSSTENEAVRPQNPEPGKERTYASAEGMLAEVHLFSDGRFEDLPDFALTNLNLIYHRAGLAGIDGSNNLAITGFRAVRDPDQPASVQASADVMNFRYEDATVNLLLEVRLDGRFFDTKQRGMTIPARKIEPPENENGSPKDVPGKRTVKFDLTGIPENADVSLHVKVDGHRDLFPLDDEAWLVLGIVRKSRVLIVTLGNPALSYFFDARSVRGLADVTYIKPDKLNDKAAYLDSAREGAFDLVIFDRCGPASEEEMPRANTMFIGHPPPPWHIGGADDGRRVEQVRFPQVRGWTDQHAVMRGLRGWHELELAEGFRIAKLPDKTPKLLESDNNFLMMFTLSRGSHTDLVMTFPLQTVDSKWNTRWFLRPLYPLFLRNVLLSLGNIRDSATEESLRPGQVKTIRTTTDVEMIEVRQPSGKSTTMERGNRAEFAFGETIEIGIYEARWRDERRRFAVNLFDAAESNLEPRESIQIGAVKVQAGQVRKEPRELWRWLVLVGLVVLVVEWWVYNRRVQV